MADFYVDENGRITTKKLKKKVTLPDYIVNTRGDILLVEEDEEDIAPVKSTVSQQTQERTWFQKSALFDDGYQFGDLTKTIIGSKTDVAENAGAGAIGMGEKLLDALLWASTYMAQGQYYSNGGGYNIKADQAFDQAISLAKTENEKFIEKDLYDEEAVAKKIISAPVKKLTGIDAETDSVFGEKSDALAQSAGQLGATVALSAAGVPWWMTTGSTAFGGEVENALNQGATMEEAGLSGAITAGAEILTEKISGGISFGGKTADEVLTKELARTISDKTLRALAKVGMDAVGEGSEEIISQVFSNLGSALYKEESLDEILFSEEAVDEYIESFIGGAVLGGGMSGINTIKSNKKGVDSVSGLTANEQQVVDKVYNDRVGEKEKSGKITEKEKRKIYDQVLSDLDRGGIDIDTIEEVLGGETYSNYKKLADAEAKMQTEYDELGKKEKYTLADDARYKELGERLKYVREKGAKNEMKTRLDEQVSSMVKDSRLSESFAERSRRGQKFEADLTQYDEKQRAIVQKAVDSGILNNTRKTHDFVDMVARIGAEKGVDFDFANNEKLKASGFAVEGKTVNGFLTKDGITVNIQSAKALNTVVGHEITHVLEGTELYTELQQAVFQYAETKQDLEGRRSTLTALYKDIKDADIDAELTADLVGDYLFTDSDFITNLSTNHRNVFQKIYDEVKYLLKVATAGSKEARELEKVKRAFEKAYRDGAKNNTAEDGGTKYSLDSDSEGVVLSDEQQEYFKDSKMVDDSGHLKVMYHGTQDGGFHEFSGDYSDDAISFFFTDSNDVAASYSGSEETYAARTLHTADDLNALFTEVGATEYTATENDGTFYLLEDGEEVAESDSAEGLYEEFRDWTGLGSGSVNYKAYLNLVNPLIVDADGGDWHSLPSIDRAADKYEYIKIVEVLDKGVKVEYSMTGDPAPVVEVVDLYDKFDDNLADTLSNMAPGEVVEGAYANPATTRDYAAYAKEHGYDGVIFKNIYDIGGYGGGGATESTVAIAFSPEQIKSVANAHPTADPDIRFSLSADSDYMAAVERGDTDTAQKMVDEAAKAAMPDTKVINEDGTPKKVYHGSVNQFNVFDYGRLGNTGHQEGFGFYFADTTTITNNYGESRAFYLDMKKPMYSDKKTITLRDLMKFMRALDPDGNGVISMYEDAGSTGYTTALRRAATAIMEYNDNDQDVIFEVANADGSNYDAESFMEFARVLRETLGYDGLISSWPAGDVFVVFDNTQMKLADPVTTDDDGKVIPLSKRFDRTMDDIRNSLSIKEADQRTFGNYNVYGRDIALEEDIAPVRQDIAPATVSQNATVQETAVYEEPEQGESVYAELDRLTEQAEELERQMYEAMDAGDNEKAMAINADLVDAAMRITELEQQLDADVQERLTSIEDADAPIVREAPYSESTDTVTLPKKMVQDIAKDARAVLGFSPKRSAEMRELIVKFSQGEIDSERLHDEIAHRFGALSEKGRQEDVAADIINPADQLQRIVEVANMDINTEQSYELDQELLESVTDNIIRGVNEYRQQQRLKMSEQNSRAAFNSLMADADRYAPATEEDIAPVRADVMQPAQESVPTAKQPIKTVKERLEAKLQNLQTELKNNLQLREESRADYELEILQAQTAYNALENKNTQKANTLLRRVERLRRISGNEDARYAKRISDLEAQVAKASEELRTGESTEAQGAMRRELHQRIVENIRAKFAERGYDLETVLQNAKDLSTFATVDNTPQRVMEKALGYKEGQILADATVNQVAENETKGIRWLNSYTDRKNGLLAQISKQYGIKPGSKESAAAQMYAEGFYVAENDDIIEYGDSELAQDFPDAKVQENIKGLARDPRIRQIYDATLAMINESRARNAYPEIQKLDNYFLHFRAMDDTFSRLGIPFNPNDIKAKDLPTDLNGVTADLKPGQPYFASAMHRRGKRTSFDLLGGLEKYLTSAKGQIYHIDDIQTLRALRNYIADTFGQAHGLDGLDAMTEEEAAVQIEQVYDGHLSTFAKFLNEEANVIAGKTALIDRGLEGIIGRRGMTFFDTLNRQVGANMVGFNVSSSLTNFIAPVQAFAKTNKAAFVKGFAQTVANRIGSIAGKGDGFAENNPTMIRRQGADRFYRTPWQKAGDLGYALMGAVDSLSTEIIVRSKYNELVSKGMSAEQAVTEADKWASRLMGDRSLGQQPQLYNSKMLGLITKFQLEVRNQLDSQFYDTIQEAKVSAEDIQNKQARNAKVAAQVASTFVQLAVVQHLFGKAFEAVAGYNPAFDIIEAIVKAFGWDDEEESEDTVLDNLGQGLASIAEDMPYYSVIKDSGRIPISSALPIGQLIKGEDKYGNEKSRLETVAETAPYWLLPGGYGQIKKTKAGLAMFDEDLPIAGSYTDSGNLRFTVEDTLANRVQAAVFGQYASANARDYFDNERQSLKKNQIQELVDVDIPIREYWDYREGLNEQETLADKFDYIADLDLPIDKKNILINNVVDRKEAVDLTDYDDYANYEEFDFAVKNPEKYDFLQSVGVSVAEYQSFDDDTKAAYNWAYENPDKYTVSRAVTDDVAVYRQYTKALNDITADKNAEGKSISGSRKTKVINYLNNLDADYYTKIILFKMEYNADDTYNREIIEYLNGRNDISFEEEVTILKELGFSVSADGTVRW